MNIQKSIKQKEQLDGYRESERLETMRKGWVDGYIEEFERRKIVKNEDKHIRGYD